MGSLVEKEWESMKKQRIQKEKHQKFPKKRSTILENIEFIEEWEKLQSGKEKDKK